MKYLLTIVMVLCFTLTKANVVTATLDSTSKKIKETTAFVDTSSTFKTMYSDIKSGLIGLAAGLKVGVEHVYMVLVKQQIVKAITQSIICIILILILIFGNKYYFKNWKYICDTGAEPTVLLVVIFDILLLSFIMSNIDTIVQGFINPEYGAIKEIIKFVK